MAVVQEQQTSNDQIEQVKARPAKQKKPLGMRGFVNSPYLFILAPLIIGGVYLVQHPALIQQGISNPYATAFVLAVPVAAFACKLVLNFFSVIEQWIRIQIEKAKQGKKGFFFEAVIMVFMFVSVCEAGPFFNDIQHNVLNGALGYITVLAFDLIAVVCIDARRKEMAKGGSKSGIYLFGVILCALVSMVANLYSALQNFQAPAAQNFPELLKQVAPYVGIMFPVMIVFLAFSRDTDIEIDDAETYRKQQQKRVDFLVVRRQILASVTHELEQIELLKKREFFLKSLFFTKKKITHVVDVVTTKVVELVNAEIKTLKDEVLQKEQEIGAQAQTIMQQVQTIQALSGEMKELAATCQDQRNQVADQTGQLARFREELQSSFDQAVAEVQQQARDQAAEQMGQLAHVREELQASVEQAIAHIQKQSTQQGEGYYQTLASRYEQDSTQIAQLREEVQSTIEQIVGQIRQENAAQHQEYYQTIVTQHDQEITQIKQQLDDRIANILTGMNQQLDDRIESTVVGINRQITDRIDQGLDQIKAQIPPTYSTVYQTGYTEPQEGINQVMIEYPIIAQWQSTGVKTVSIDQIIKGTGLSPQRVRNAEKNGAFSGTRGEGLYRVGSVIEWLKTVPVPKVKDKINQPTSGPLNETLSDQITEEMEPITVGNAPANEGLNQTFETPELSHID